MKINQNELLRLATPKKPIKAPSLEFRILQHIYDHPNCTAEAIRREFGGTGSVNRILSKIKSEKIVNSRWCECKRTKFLTVKKSYIHIYRSSAKPLN